MAKLIEIDVLLRQAYEMLKTHSGTPQFDRTSSSLLNQLIQEISKWNRFSSVSAFDSCWTDPAANAVAAEGTAVMNKANFTDVFLRDATTQDKIGQLLLLRQNGPLNYRLINKIAEVGLIEHLNKGIIFPKGNKPLFYVHRLEIMIFPELFTSIADRGHLDETAMEMDIKSKNVGFERVQFQVRDKVETFLQTEGLLGESEFVKRGIAWWVIEAAKVLRSR